MARRIVTVAGRTNGDGPPPSTLAAQLVQNQSRPVINQPTAGVPSFREILHDLLYNDAAVQENDVNVNAQLVSAVAEAGLRPLRVDNPFADYNDLLSQATDSLAVIQKTFVRQPEVLLVSQSPNGPQTILGLVAALFSVAGRPKCHGLPIAELLNTVIRTFDHSVNFWSQAYSLQTLLQESVDDLLTGLDAMPPSTVLINVRVPPARAVFQFWPNSEAAITVPPGTQTFFDDPAHALAATLQVLDVDMRSKQWVLESTQRLQRLAFKLKPRLANDERCEQCIDKLLQGTSNVPLIKVHLQGPSGLQPSVGVQKQLARALFDNMQEGVPFIRDSLLLDVQSMGQDAIFPDLHEDLRIAITAWYCRFLPESEYPENITSMRDALRQENVMSDSEFVTVFQRLSAHDPNRTASKRSPRHRKSLTEDSQLTREQITRQASRLLTGIEAEDPSNLPDVAASIYAKLDEEQQCAAWQCLADLAQHELKITTRTTIRLLQSSDMRERKRPRILSLLTIQECVKRLTDADTVNLATGPMGKHCLASLHSSIREMRITAGKTLPLFLGAGLPETVRNENCRTALQYLRSLSARDVASEQETLVSAWGEIALVCTGGELNLVLLQLVEYLGHKNAVICGHAFAELEKVAETSGGSIAALLKPFWRSIAVSVVQELHVKPQKAQQLCDLMDMDVTQFLTLTQRETLPTLVLTKKRGVIERIANARGHGTTVEDVLLQPRTNLVAVLGLLLIQPSTDIEESALSCLNAVAPGFRRTDTDLSSFIKMDPELIACEMLKLCGDESETRKSRAYHSFNVFVSLAERERASTQRKAQSRSGKDMLNFFDNRILGILTQFSVEIASEAGNQSTSEKLRCLKAISEMFVLTKGNVSGALPQIKACLQSGLGQPKLCETAFRAWLSMLAVLPSDDIANVIEETFALTLRHWTTFSVQLQHQTHESIQQLVKAHQTILRENVMSLPSLSGIPLLSKIAAEFERFKPSENIEVHLTSFAQRLVSDSTVVVLQALAELVPYLERYRDSVHDIAASDSPASALSALLRALLDATVKFSSSNVEAAEQCGKALGIIGSLDPNRIEAPRKKRRVLLLSNFEKASEAIDWTLTLLEDVLVKIFNSATNARTQGFLAHAIQELLRFCEIGENMLRARASQSPEISQRWDEMPENVRITLTPFLTSRYRVTSNNPINAIKRTYPGFSADSSHAQWLGSLTYDLMFRAKGDNAQVVFPLLARIIRGHEMARAKTVRGHDLAVARFVFPYAVLNIILGGTVPEIKDLSAEFLAVLQAVAVGVTQQETVRLCCESIFDTLDYISTWLMEKRRLLAVSRIEAYKTGHTSNEFDEAKDMGQIESVEQFLSSIPAETVAKAALECRSFARALYHWEQFIRTQRSLVPSGLVAASETDLYGRLLDIYAEIDEPDGLDGVSAHLSFITEQQRAINHERAGRWTAAQAWYELRLSDKPREVALQHDLLRCLRETGRHAPLLRYVDSFVEQGGTDQEQSFIGGHHLSLAAEASWMTNDLDGLRRRLTSHHPRRGQEFNVGVATILLHASDHATQELTKEITDLRRVLTESLSVGGTESLQACHQEIFKLHVLYEMESMMLATNESAPGLLHTLEKRLTSVGSYIQDKQFLLGVRRVVMQLRPEVFNAKQMGSLWLHTARLARQTKDTENAYSAVLKATECGDRSAKIEEAKLLWHDGHQRQAIQSLESAVDSGVFEMDETELDSRSAALTESTNSSVGARQQNTLRGKALLLLAKWLDASGQSQTKDMSARYQAAARGLQRGERGHYYLSKHYIKLLDAQRALPKEKRADAFATGDMVKVIIDNCLRSLPFGCKYWHESIPRLLTLWLELGSDTLQKAPKETHEIFDKRRGALSYANKQVQKYFERVPPSVLYNALPQLISRITHPHPDIWKQLSNILTRIAAAHPNQVLWSLLAVIKANDPQRVARGTEILNRLKDPKLRSRSDSSNLDLRGMITHGQRLSDGLLQACEEPVESRAVYVSLSKNLKFNHKLAPSHLVVPIEATLNARSPPHGANSDQIKKYKAFTQDKVTIQAFDDSVLVLSSLQRPRKITVRGSDGKQYGLLCKPKDDLRKDQRLMEFNGIINRALKRNIESSKRRLYIKTYAVTPLSEESGTIEWVEGIKPIRDILLNLYQRKGIRPNYNDIRKKLDEASLGPEKAPVFTRLLEDEFPPVLHEWLAETYPEPEAWFTARLRYARSAAVMSMTGHMLGLGDRHGENILLEESTGGVFHVDFNCLFDKGLSFEKPEMVPFRLTHNMVDAMGAYGYEGPFRKSCELTLGLLRQERDTLMTVLETFLYDPTTDFVGKKKRSASGMPETPAEILESVATKLKGLLKGETVPLSVEGYVDALIQHATDSWNLARMYIGWCSFL